MRSSVRLPRLVLGRVQHPGDRFGGRKKPLDAGLASTRLRARSTAAAGRLAQPAQTAGYSTAPELVCRVAGARHDAA